MITTLLFDGQPIEIDTPLPAEHKGYFVKVSHLVNLLRQEYIFKRFEADAETEKITLAQYEIQRINPETNIVEKKWFGQFESAPGQFEQFYMLPTGSTPFGVIAARNLCNGMTSDALKCRFFDVVTLAPRQPVRYKLESEPINTTFKVTATVKDGIAPFKIKVAGGTYTDGLILSGLAVGTHEIYVQDAAGTEQKETITLNLPEDE